MLHSVCECVPVSSLHLAELTFKPWVRPGVIEPDPNPSMLDVRGRERKGPPVENPDLEHLHLFCSKHISQGYVLYSRRFTSCSARVLGIIESENCENDYFRETLMSHGVKTHSNKE